MTKMMKQAVMTAPKIIEFRQTGIPVFGAEEVLIKIMRVGICGSDIHVYHGIHPYTTFPVVQGHETSGEVVKIGASVTSLKVGDKVVPEPQVYCGKCYPCTHGMYNICNELKVIGFQQSGRAAADRYSQIQY